MIIVIVCMLASSKVYNTGYYHFTEFHFSIPSSVEIVTVLPEGVIVVLQEVHVHVHCLLQCLL